MDELKEALDFVSAILKSGVVDGKINPKCKIRSSGRLASNSNITKFGTIKIGSKVMYFLICHNITNGKNYVNVTKEQPSSEVIEVIEVFELNKLLLLDAVSRFFKLRVSLTLGAKQ